MPRVRVWWAPVTVFTAALAVYLLTAPRGLTWVHDSADGGDLIAAALVAGVPHPPGAPTFTLLARLATRLPWGTPAWRVAALSAVGGALAAALTAATVQALAAGPTPRSSLRPWPALAAGAMLAFSPLLWGQATVAEVYAWQACLAAALIGALLRWQRSRRWPWTALAGGAWGLALGIHLTAVAWLPLAAGWLVGGWRRNGGWRSLIGFAVAALGALSVYAYLPLAAAGNPPVNWGDPRTLDGFLWVVTGQLYRGYALAVPAAGVVARAVAWAGLVWRQFLPWGVALALLGLACAAQRNRWLTAAAVASFLLGLAWAAGYNTADSIATLTPGWVLIAIAAGLGLHVVVQRLAVAGRGGAAAAVALCLAIALAPLALHWSAHDQHQDHQAETFVAQVLADSERNALVVTAGDRATFSLWYARYGLGRRPDLAPVSRDLWPLASYRRTVGYTHPDLAGPEPPEDWLAFLLSVADRRAVYLAQVEGGPVDLATLGLPADAPFHLEAVAGEGGRPVALWRLRPSRAAH